MAFPSISRFRVEIEHFAINSGTQVSSFVVMVPARFVAVSVQSLSSNLRLQGSFSQNSADFRPIYISDAPGANVFGPWELVASQAPAMVTNLRPFAFPYLRAFMVSPATSTTTVSFIFTRQQAI